MRTLSLWTVVSAFAGLLATLAPTATATAAQLDFKCANAVESDVETIRCQVRSVTDTAPTDLKITRDNGESVAFTSDKFDWTRHPTAYYFVVQTGEYTSSELRTIGNFVERVAFPVGKRQTAIATVSDVSTERAAMGAFARQIQDAARTIGTSPAGARMIEITDVLSKPLEDLEKAEGYRKALVIVSDGSSTMDAAERDELVQEAKKKGVLIYSLIVVRSSRAKSDLLKAAAEQSGGASRELTSLNETELLQFASDFPKFLENGYVVEIDARGLPATAELEAEGTLAGNVQHTSDTQMIERLTEDTAMFKAFDFARSNVLAVLASFVLLTGFGLVMASYLRGGGGAAASAGVPTGAQPIARNPISGPPSTPHEGATEIIFRPSSSVPDTTPKAWLEIIGVDADRLPLRPGEMRVGRHAENEICLKNNSVHRKHAVLRIATDGVVVVRDLDTKNGVLVNGVRGPEHRLRDGDLVELGEVKLRFIANPDRV
jgi:hypothetical protein